MLAPDLDASPPGRAGHSGPSAKAFRRASALRTRGTDCKRDRLRPWPARPRVADRQQASTRGTHLLCTPRCGV